MLPWCPKARVYWRTERMKDPLPSFRHLCHATSLVPQMHKKHSGTTASILAKSPKFLRSSHKGKEMGSTHKYKGKEIISSQFGKEIIAHVLYCTLKVLLAPWKNQLQLLPKLGAPTALDSYTFKFKSNHLWKQKNGTLICIKRLSAGIYIYSLTPRFN